MPQPPPSSSSTPPGPSPPPQNTTGTKYIFQLVKMSSNTGCNWQKKYLQVYLKLQALATERRGSSAKNASTFLKSPTSTLLHTISESEKVYISAEHCLKYLLANNTALGCSKLINVVVGTIDERAINTKRILNPWERNEDHALCLNSAKAIGCIVVNIETRDFIEGRGADKKSNKEKKKGKGILRHGSQMKSFIPLFWEPSGIEKILREANQLHIRPHKSSRTPPILRSTKSKAADLGGICVIFGCILSLIWSDIE